MTLEEFRLKHSELIEHYQFIEHHLEDIYADVQGDKKFYEGLMDVENDNISRLVHKLCELQEMTGLPTVNRLSELAFRFYLNRLSIIGCMEVIEY